jgi:hypothetical protein
LKRVEFHACLSPHWGEGNGKIRCPGRPSRVTLGITMPGDLVASNGWLFQRAKAAQELLNSNHVMRLFGNDYAPTPESAEIDFIEATFPGYARWNMTGVWKDPLKVQSGNYAIRSARHTFVCVGPTAFTVYGMYILEGTFVKFSARFPSPIPMGIGAIVTVSPTVEVFAASIL